MEAARQEMLAARRALEEHIAGMRKKDGWGAGRNAELFDALQAATDKYLMLVARFIQVQRDEMNFANL
jgi:hypothetical protein